MDTDETQRHKSASVSGEEIDWGERTLNGQEDMNNTRDTDWVKTLLRNAHCGLPSPLPDEGKYSLVSGECLYFHYGCDGKDDRGWGCGYRTVQTMASWLSESGSLQPKGRCRSPPSLPEIQQALTTMGDKPSSFVGSREWIGTYEASLVLDYFYDVPCKVVHIRGGGAELEQVAVKELHQHFQKHGSPAMMGGDRDNSSKGILGVATCDRGSYLLVMDPHYYGPPLNAAQLQQRGWVAWKRVSSLDQCSFYNLCLPQTARK